MNNIIINRSLKTTKMPISGPPAERNKMAKLAVEKSYKMIVDKADERGNTSDLKLNNMFLELFPKIDIVAKQNTKKISGRVRSVNNENHQIIGFEYLINFDENGLINIKIPDNADSITHELSHFTEAIYCPKFSATIQEFIRKAMRKISATYGSIQGQERRIILKKEEYNTLYDNLLYNRDIDIFDYQIFRKNYLENAETKKNVTKTRIANLKNRYAEAMNEITTMIENEKVIILKEHIRKLESENKAYKIGLHYKFKNNKNKAAKLEEKNETKMLFLFTEKIKMLKTLFYKEIKNERKKHWSKLGLKYGAKN